MLHYYLLALTAVAHVATWASPIQPIPNSQSASKLPLKPHTNFIHLRNLRKRVLDPDNRNIWMSAADSITGTSRNLRETSDPADFNYNPADPPRLNAIQTALVHARELADAALEVEANDPLWRHYFGDDSEEAQQIVRRVLRDIRDFAPAPEGNFGIGLIITRYPSIVNNPNDDQQRVGGRTRAEMRGIDLFDPFFALPELGAPATQILPQLPLNEGRLNADEDVQDADSETQGATLLHELVHYVTFHNAGTFRPLHDQLNNIRQQNGHNPLNFVGALDIRPARYANGNQDQDILNRMRNDRGSQRAYDYNTLTQMVEMTNGPQMALMNAHNYVQFALAAFFNRRAGTGTQLQNVQAPRAIDLAQEPTIWVNGIDINGEFFTNARLAGLLLTLRLYNSAGALGKTRI